MSAHAEEREQQRSFWQQHSTDPSVEAMMLDSKAAEIDALERPEVLTTLGDVSGRRVLELGAGIGRFTGQLASAAAHVTAADFMETSIAANKRAHGSRPNVDFLVADVTEMDMPSCSYDVVFSNWLLMYLSDDEVLALACNVLNWLSDGGVLFFRESCYKQSGDKPRESNPTHYRSPEDYSRLFSQASVKQADGSVARYHLQLQKAVDTYIKVKQNSNQICWRYVKVLEAGAPSNGHATNGHAL